MKANKSGFIPRLLFLGAVLFAAACATGGISYVALPFNQSDLDTALRAAMDSAPWTPEKRVSFHASVARLPGKQRFEVYRQLSADINSGKVKVPDDVAGPIF